MINQFSLFLAASLPTPEETIPDPFHLPEGIKEVEPTKTFYGEFFYMLLMLGALISLLYFLSFYMRRIVNSQIEKQNADSEIKVIEKRALSSKTTLYLIECNEKEYLIAESPSGVTEIKGS